MIVLDGSMNQGPLPLAGDFLTCKELAGFSNLPGRKKIRGMTLSFY